MGVTNIKWNDCRLFHSGISISKKERRRKLFCFNLVTTVCYFIINSIYVKTFLLEKFIFLFNMVVFKVGV